jgi:hypothetical protein
MSLIPHDGSSGEREKRTMTGTLLEEHLVEQTVTYPLLTGGRFYIIENVPARVNLKTSEQ